jgi:hypothetical protein
MSAYSILARAVDKIHHAEEQKLTAIRHAIQKAITANELEGQRTFDKLTDKRNPNWAAVAQEGHHTNSVRAELKNALETVEACIQQHWKREHHEMRQLPPLVQLLDFATEPQRALAAEEFAGRFLAHREKARLRDRRYRGLKALPAPERAAELAASAENATPATPQAQWLTTQIRQAVSEIGQHGGKLDTVVAAQR